MTQDEILEGNIIIAKKFRKHVTIVYTKLNGDRSMVSYDIDKVTDFSKAFLIYHSSWDHIMPIAKKLSEISKYQPVSFTKSILDFDIEKVFEHVVDYIKWLNKNELSK